MKLHERLSWILDRPHSEIEEMQAKWSGDEYLIEHLRPYEEENYRRNIEFVHSLGLKCDCVGWSSLDLTRPDAGEILDRIDRFCREEGWLARGVCARRYEDFESDWYELELPAVKDICNYVKTVSESGERVTVKGVRAYKNKGAHALYGYHGDFYVSEHFRDACIRHQVPGVHFCWARDQGRFASEQYFAIYADRNLSRIACDRFLRYQDVGRGYPVTVVEHQPGSALYSRLEAVGGMLPRVAEIFYDMQFSLPDYYPVSELPEEGFAHVYWGKGDYYMKEKLLVHRRTAEMLLEERLLSRKNLQPAFLYQDGQVPPGYYEAEMDPFLRPCQTYIDQMQREYEAYIQQPHPVRKATEKEAVQLLRRAKTVRKEDFRKRMKKETAAALADTAFAPLAPYYLAAEGGDLSDEYRLLSYEEAGEETDAFAAGMEKEELLPRAIEGVVFAACMDGDKVILRPDGTAARVSHEVPEVVEEWPSLAQFFTECIEIEEE